MYVDPKQYSKSDKFFKLLHHFHEERKNYEFNLFFFKYTD